MKAMCALLLLLATLAASANEAVYTVTAYCHCAKCCGKSGKPTASGVMPTVGVTVAGPRSVKFGTKIHIQGIGERIVQDRLSKRRDGRIDIFVASHEEAKQFGIQKLKVRIGSADSPRLAENRR